MAGYGRMGAKTSGAAGAAFFGACPEATRDRNMLDLGIARMKHHHVVVVSQFSDGDQGGLAARVGHRVRDGVGYHAGIARRIAASDSGGAP